jgi:hypothetical protein
MGKPSENNNADRIECTKTEQIALALMAEKMASLQAESQMLCREIVASHGGDLKKNWILEAGKIFKVVKS